MCVNVSVRSVSVVRWCVFTSDSLKSRQWSKPGQTETDRQRRTGWAGDGSSPVLALDACVSGRQITGANSWDDANYKKSQVHLNAMTSLSTLKKKKHTCSAIFENRRRAFLSLAKPLNATHLGFSAPTSCRYVQQAARSWRGRIRTKTCWFHSPSQQEVWSKRWAGGYSTFMWVGMLNTGKWRGLCNMETSCWTPAPEDGFNRCAQVITHNACTQISPLHNKCTVWGQSQSVSAFFSQR